ncbi:unnamed protein product, partial [Sphagnum jensenii]
QQACTLFFDMANRDTSMKTNISINIVEVLNEEIYDLLATNPESIAIKDTKTYDQSTIHDRAKILKSNLTIRTFKNKVVVEGLTEWEANNIEEIDNHLETALKNRHKIDYSNSENINNDNDHDNNNNNNVARESNDSSIYIKLHEITTVESIKVNEESNQDDKNSNVINKLNNQIAELQNSSNSLHKSKSIEAFQKITNQTNFVTDDSNISIEHSKYPVASDRLE